MARAQKKKKKTSTDHFYIFEGDLISHNIYFTTLLICMVESQQFYLDIFTRTIDSVCACVLLCYLIISYLTERTKQCCAEAHYVVTGHWLL